MNFKHGPTHRFHTIGKQQCWLSSLGNSLRLFLGLHRLFVTFTNIRSFWGNVSVIAFTFSPLQYPQRITVASMIPMHTQSESLYFSHYSPNQVAILKEKQAGWRKKTPKSIILRVSSFLQIYAYFQVTRLSPATIQHYLKYSRSFKTRSRSYLW